jgi:aspartate aminotransferase
MDGQTPQFFRVMQYAAAADRDVVDMVSGSPDWEPPEALREGLRAYADADPAEFQYPPSAGLGELRERIGQRRGVDPDRVLVTNGAGEANHLAMAAALESRGSEVLLADPAYPYYAGRADFLGADVTYVPTGADGELDPVDVRDRIDERTAALVLNTPNNPTGAVYGAETVAALAEAARSHDAVLISDEVYDHFDYAGRFASALGVDSSNCVVTNSVSKSMAITGWRVGYAVFPDPDGPGGDLLADARTRHMLTNVTGSRPAQTAVSHALEHTDPAYYETARARLRERIDAFTGALDEIGAAYSEPAGGFYVTAELPGVSGSFEGVERLVDEAGVAGMPAAAFGTADSGEWIRFALVTPRVETAADRLRSYLD